MNSLYQLHDPKHNAYYLIDASACTLSVKHEYTHKQTRLKKYAAEILANLFSQHPNPISYKDIQTILKNIASFALTKPGCTEKYPNEECCFAHSMRLSTC